jgi:predicted phage-related endonuclease
LAALAVSEQDVDVIAAYVQGSAEWLRSRVGRITSSNFGAAMGINPFTSRRQLLKQLLWGGFHGNVATAWGQNHENVARLEYIENIEDEIRQQLIVHEASALKTNEIDVPPKNNVSSILDDDAILISISIEETGLLITPERPWMGNSPDGIIHLTYKSGRKEKGLLEIKCPFKKQFYTPNPVPAYYYSQIQGTMGNLGLPWCDFVVWTPTGMQVTRVLFDQSYWDDDMLPKVTQFYFDMYMPLAIQKQKGVLPTNQIDLI